MMHRLLIVDDEPLIRKGLLRMIGRIAPEWNDCAEAGNGQEALDRVREQVFHLIISDIRMPVMDGLELQERLAGRGSAIPLVFLTGFDDFAYVQRALRGRAYDFLLKPVNDEDMLRVLDAFKKDFTAEDKTVRTAVAAKLQQFEFDLANALESMEEESVAIAVARHREMLEQHLSPQGFAQELIRITSAYFLKRGINGYDWYSMRSGAYADLDTVLHVLKLQLEAFPKAQPNAHADRIIEKAKAYIRDHIDKPISLATVADSVHLNMNYFSEFFRENAGETFTQFVTRTRIEEAKRLLRNPEIKIHELADRLGYMNPRYFSKAFKQLVGMTPKEYRERIQG